MRLINKFNYNDKEFFTNLAETEGIKNKKEFWNELGLDDNTLKVEYYKDNKGNLYKHTYFNGNKINWNDLNGYYKGRVYEFENETNVLFQ